MASSDLPSLTVATSSSSSTRKSSRGSLEKGGGPPLSRAERILDIDHTVRASGRYRPRNDCIAAIDFGTSCLSLAYTTPHFEGKPKVLQLYRTFERVPNAILMQQDEESGECIVKWIGYEAQEVYSSARYKCRYIYFERIKSLLERDKDINRDYKVESFTGGYYYLIEVIAFIIKHLKEKLLTHLHDERLSSTDFDWVITVPAIWKARARRMMREAAYLAGLTSDHDVITKFTDISSGTLPRPPEVNPHKLTLALEPEAAAIYAHKYTESRLPPPPDRYMVVDIGGGTVDITVHDRTKGKPDVILPPIGNVWGGTTINQALKLTLEKLVQDPGHEEFIRKCQQTAHIALNDLYYQEFEREKKKFGDTYKKIGTASKGASLDEAAISLPRSFVDFYGNLRLDKEAERQGLVFEVGEGKLFIRYDFLERETFQFTLDNIIECIREAIQNLTKKVDTIYLVGGFGGCQFVKTVLQEVLGRHHCTAYDHIVCPLQADLAVCIGAVQWRQDPDIIQSRIADATYGISLGPQFNPLKHDKHYLYTDEDGIRRCHHVFEVFILKGETIENNVVYKTGVNPLYQSDTTMTVSIYSTTEDGVQYTKDKEGKSTLHKLGELFIEIPNPDNIPRVQRGVEVFMDFSATEIQARAMYMITQEEVKTVCDFLSYQLED